MLRINEFMIEYQLQRGQVQLLTLAGNIEIIRATIDKK